MNKFAENFNRILTERNISQTQIAECLRVKPNTVNQWAHGKRDPDFDMLVKICLLLGTTPDVLLGFEEIERHCKDSFIRDIVGNDKQFQAAQIALLDKMQASGQDGMREADEALYNQFLSNFRAKFGF